MPQSPADVRLDQTTGDLLPSLDGFDTTMGPEMLQALKQQAEQSGETVEPEVPATNPYGPPVPQVQAAGFGIRFAASLIDGVWMAALGAGSAFLIDPQIGGLIGSGLSLLIVLFGWAVWGTTPGKRACKLYLSAGASNQAGIGFPRAVARLFGYLVSTIPLFLGFLVVAFNSSKRGWHDLIAGTEVRRQA